jgi:hypothetical protein
MAFRSWSLLSLALALTACQPIYGGKPERLHNPPTKKPPADAAPAVEEVKLIDECNADFRGDPRKAQQQASIARPLFDQAETAIASSDREKDEQKKVALVKEAIDKYRNALIHDPYNVEATLKLAVAYDKAHRRGCAIAMLKRLASLGKASKLSAEASRNIDAIDANGQWFKAYRKEAMAAVER